MMTIFQLIETLEFIKKAHEGQMYGNFPYYVHPLEVALIGSYIFKEKFEPESYIVSALHDVIEDTKYTREDLSKMGYSDIVLDAVDLLTKDKSLSYDENIQRIIKSGNKIAMQVKFADNYVNYKGDKSDWDQKRVEKSQKKYLKSMQDLGNVLNIDVDYLLNPSTKLLKSNNYYKN
jgi:(p)ppGpp synthase/HD superfamily hydrolase